MIAAQIENGKVVNLIVIDSLSQAPGCIDGTGAAIGDEWDGAKFSRPAQQVLVPDMVTMRQARLALLAANKLTAVNQAVANMAGASGETVRIEWEFSSVVERNKPTVTAIAQVLGWSSADLDQLFINAAKL